MNMIERPDLVQKIEIMDGEHFLRGSLARFCFSVISAPDASGLSLSVEGEVFPDAIWVNGLDYFYRNDDLGEPQGYEDDITSRRIVASTLFGYEHSPGQGQRDADQLIMDVS